MSVLGMQHDIAATCPRSGEDAAECECLDHCGCSDFAACPTHAAEPALYVPPFCGGDQDGCRVVVLGEDDAGREWCEAHRVMVD